MPDGRSRVCGLGGSGRPQFGRLGVSFLYLRAVEDHQDLEQIKLKGLCTALMRLL
jgi:hypothetical protein